MAVPIQRNSRDDNEQIKRGETPDAWSDEPAKRRQKDTEARWTKKHGKSHYGYKNHVNIDRRHKLIRRFRVTDAAVHDSQVIEELLTSDKGYYCLPLAFGGRGALDNPVLRGFAA